VHKVELEAMAQALMEHETLSGEDCKAIMRGEKVVRGDGNDGPKGPAVPATGRVRTKAEPEPGTGGAAPLPA